MSFHVHPALLLFDDLNDEEAWALACFVRKIVIDGHIDLEHEAYRAWTAGAHLASTPLLVYTVLFPQRALLSLVDRTMPAPKMFHIETLKGQDWTRFTAEPLIGMDAAQAHFALVVAHRMDKDASKVRITPLTDDEVRRAMVDAPPPTAETK